MGVYIYISIYIYIRFGFPIAGMDDQKLINQVDHVVIAQAPANGAGPTATSATERNRSLQQLSRWEDTMPLYPIEIYWDLSSFFRPSIFFRLTSSLGWAPID